MRKAQAEKVFGAGIPISRNSSQDDNGYRPGVVYWFRYEPLQWRVLNPYTGFVLCESVIDAQDFHHTTASHANGKYASNWGESDIRTFLNTTFMNTAFNGAEQQAILSANLDTPCPRDSNYNAGKTTDKVFLLSYYDVINPAYGFAAVPPHTTPPVCRRAVTMPSVRDCGFPRATRTSETHSGVCTLPMLVLTLPTMSMTTAMRATIALPATRISGCVRLCGSIWALSSLNLKLAPSTA